MGTCNRNHPVAAESAWPPCPAGLTSYREPSPTPWSLSWCPGRSCHLSRDTRKCVHRASQCCVTHTLVTENELTMATGPRTLITQGGIRQYPCVLVAKVPCWSPGHAHALFQTHLRKHQLVSLFQLFTCASSSVRSSQSAHLGKLPDVPRPRPRPDQGQQPRTEEGTE